MTLRYTNVIEFTLMAWDSEHLQDKENTEYREITENTENTKRRETSFQI